MNFVIALLADSLGTTNNKAAPILANSGKYMYSGTSTTTPQDYDYQLGTTAAVASGAITPSLGYSADNATIQYVGTILYSSMFAITEWGLFNVASQGSLATSTTNTWNAQGQASATWGSSLTTNEYAGYIAVGGTVGMFILSNTSGSSGTITGAISPQNAFYDLTSGGGGASTPATNTSFSIYPLMSDHKTFSAINVISGDSIQFTYTLTMNSGG